MNLSWFTILGLVFLLSCGGGSISERGDMWHIPR